MSRGARRSARMRSAGRGLAIAGVAAVLGCASRQRTTTPGSAAVLRAEDGVLGTTEPGGGPAAQSRECVVIDGEKMLAMARSLADDGLGGRHTLEPRDLQGAAKILAVAYADAGLVPVAPQYEVQFAVTTGVRNHAAPQLAIGTAQAGNSVGADDFVARAIGSEGTATGELVFVGYGARGDGASAGYDDLDGIDLSGKIAVLLLDAPGRPNAEALSSAVTELVERFNRATESLRAEGTIQALHRARQHLREDIGKLIAPYGARRGPSKPYEPVAEDPRAPASARAWLASVEAQIDLGFAPDFSADAGSLRLKLRRLAQAGVVGAIVVQGPNGLPQQGQKRADSLPVLEDERLRARAPFPVVQMRWHAADRLIRVGGRTLSSLQKAIDRQLRPQSAEIPGVFARITTDFESVELPAQNVVAAIGGTDLADDVVLVGAHYDHIGRAGNGHCEARYTDGTTDQICNGADDNASGSAMVVALAQAFARKKSKPRRTIVFANFAGEEIGLLGSAALVDALPTLLPGKRVVAMINLDMVGRLGANGLVIGGVGSSPRWMSLLEPLEPANVSVLYERSVTSRSDHANFYRHDIPVLFFFTGLHDDYHRPGDEAEKLNGAGMTTIATMVAGVVERLGEGESIPFSPAQRPKEGLVNTLPGADPSTIERVTRPTGQ